MPEKDQLAARLTNLFPSTLSNLPFAFTFNLPATIAKSGLIPARA